MRVYLTFVIYFIGYFALQCAARPHPQEEVPYPAPAQEDVSSYQPESSPVDGQGQVIFDENSQPNLGGSEYSGVNGDLPPNDESQPQSDDGTVANPCEGEDDCPAASVTVYNIEEAPNAEGGENDGASDTSGNDDDVGNTTETPVLE